MPAMCCSRRVSIATSTVNSNSRQSTCGAARGASGEPGDPGRVGHRPGAAGHVRLVVALLRRERVQRVAAVAFEVAPLRRVDDEAEEPLVGDDRRDRVHAGPAVGADRGQVAEARPVLLEQSADRRRRGGARRRRIRTRKPCGHSIEHMYEQRTRHAGHAPDRHRQSAMVLPMLLSDRDLVSEIKAGTLALEPFEPTLVQPSSIDVRLDRLFRVFNNHLYTHIDPAEQQDDLTVDGRGRRRRAVRAAPGRVRARLDARGDHARRPARRPAGGQVAAWAGSGCSPTRPPASSTRASPVT